MPLPISTNIKLKITSTINSPVIAQMSFKLSHGCDVIYMPERERAKIESSLKGNNFNSIRTIKTILVKIADIARIHPHLSIFLFSRNLLRSLPIAKAKGKLYITPIKTNIAINHINCHSTDMAIPKGMANKAPATRAPKSR